MAWPLSQDYNEAIQSPAENFADADLQAGEAVTNALGLPKPSSGNFADVYEVRGPQGGRWAVKCFTREVPGRRERYTEISRHLRHGKLPFMVDFSYLEQGIRVGGTWYPVLKMQWVEGLTFNQFVAQNLDKPVMLEALFQIWRRMAKILHAAEVGHCDLQHGNVLLVPDAATKSLALKLIDYDGMWLPALAAKSSGELGHPSYQHPQRSRDESYRIEVDRMPVLLIATALRALKLRGKPLWDKFNNGDNLLFKEADLLKPDQSALFRELLQIDDLPTVQLTDAVRAALQAELANTPLLEAVLIEPPTALLPREASAPREVAWQVGRKAPEVRAAPPSTAVKVVSMKQALATPATESREEDEDYPDSPARSARRNRSRRRGEPAPRGAVPTGVWIGAFVGLGALVLLLLCGGAVGAIYWAAHGHTQLARTTTPVPNPITASDPRKDKDPSKDGNAIKPDKPDKPAAGGNIVLSDWQVTTLEGFSWKDQPLTSMKHTLDNGVLEITNNKVGADLRAGIATKRIFTGDYTITAEVRNVTKEMGLHEPNDDGFTTVWDRIGPLPGNDWHTVVIRCAASEVAITVDGKAANVDHPHPGKLKSALFYIHIGINDTAAIRRFEVVAGDRPPPKSDGPVRNGETVAGWGRVSDPDRDCNVAQNGQALTIDVPATPHDLVARENRVNGPRVLQEVEGDFTIQVKVCGELRPTTPGTVPGHVAYQAGGILVWSNAQNFIRLERAGMVRGGVRSLAALELHAGGQVTASSSSPVKDQDTYLRLQRRGNQVLSAFSQDGKEWTNLQAIDNVSFPAKVGIGVAAINAAKQPLALRYEGLEISRNSTKGPVLESGPLAPALADMKSANGNTRQAAMDTLLNADPKERSATVIKALEAMLAESDGGVRNNAVRVLGAWATKECVSVLLDQINHPQADTRRAIMEALGKCRDPRAVEPVARQLANLGDRGAAVKSLQYMGPTAESTMLLYLKTSNLEWGREACQVLKVVGTKESIPFLQQFVVDKRSFLFRSVAEEALQCVIGRADALANRDPRVVEALVQRMANAGDRGSAAKLLQYMGPAAESALLSYIKETDLQWGREACQILQVVGTKESIAPLEELVGDKRSFFFRSVAEEALECVKGRAAMRP